MTILRKRIMALFTKSELAILEKASAIYARKLTKTPAFENAELTKKYFQMMLANKKREHFGVLYLNSQHQMIGKGMEVLFSGTVDSASVYPRIILQKALKVNANAIFCVHNHPSGIAEPSQADIQITKRIIAALETCDIKLLDHFIVSVSGVTSLAQRGVL